MTECFSKASSIQSFSKFYIQQRWLKLVINFYQCTEKAEVRESLGNRVGVYMAVIKLGTLCIHVRLDC